MSIHGAFQELVRELIEEPDESRRQDYLTSIERGLLRTTVEVEVRARAYRSKKGEAA
jgi:hypothetical protein